MVLRNGSLEIRNHLRKKCPYSELFWPASSRIQTEHGEIRSISPYSARMRENADQKTQNTDTFHATLISFLLRNFIEKNTKSALMCFVNIKI